MWELFAAIHDWFGGADVSDYPLWWWPVWVWGRVGKGLQFVAGLVVIFDLLSPEKMRKKGKAAKSKLALSTEHWHRRKTAKRVEDIRDALEECLDFRRERPKDKEAWSTAPIPDRVTGFGESDLRDWVRGTRAEMNPQNWYWVSGSRQPYLALDTDDRAWVNRRVREFLHAHLPPSEYEAWRALGPRITRRQILTGAFWWTLSFGIVVVPALLSPQGFLQAASQPLTFWGIVPSTVALTIGTFALLGHGDLFLVRLLRLPQIAFYSVIASILNSTRPGHKLRWLALIFFVSGSFFDVLAS